MNNFSFSSERKHEKNPCTSLFCSAKTRGLPQSFSPMLSNLYEADTPRECCNIRLEQSKGIKQVSMTRYFGKTCLLAMKSSVRNFFSFWCFIIIRMSLTFLMASHRSFRLVIKYLSSIRFFLYQACCLVESKNGT